MFNNMRMHGMDNFKILKYNFKKKQLNTEMDFWTRAADY
jgi:hypothetical protein